MYFIFQFSFCKYKDKFKKNEFSLDIQNVLIGLIRSFPNVWASNGIRSNYFYHPGTTVLIFVLKKGSALKIKKPYDFFQKS